MIIMVKEVNDDFIHVSFLLLHGFKIRFDSLNL